MVLFFYNLSTMNTQINATLTGSDSPVGGLARYISYPGFTDAYEFLSTDGTLHLIIARNNNGNWTRVAGTDPYFSGWVAELAEQVSA